MLVDLAFWKDLGESLASFATALALILGGFWTYLAFIRQRLALPRIEVTVTAHEAVLANGLLLRAQITLRNSGSVVATSNRGEIRLRQVIPAPNDIEEAVASGMDPVSADCTQIEWPMLAGRKWTWKKDEFEIEPGEADLLCADFFVPTETRVVELYFFLENARKKRQGIGWTASHLYHISNQGGPNVQEKHEGRAARPEATSEVNTEQQKPKPPQPQLQDKVKKK